MDLKYSVIFINSESLTFMYAMCIAWERKNLPDARPW